MGAVIAYIISGLGTILASVVGYFSAETIKKIAVVSVLLTAFAALVNTLIDALTSSVQSVIGVVNVPPFVAMLVPSNLGLYIQVILTVKIAILTYHIGHKVISIKLGAA